MNKTVNEFIEPEVEVIRFSSEDIICNSGGEPTTEHHEANGISGWMF